MQLLNLVLALAGLALALPQNPGAGAKDCIAFKEMGWTPGPRGWRRDDGLCYDTPLQPAVDIKADCFCMFYSVKNCTDVDETVWVGSNITNQAVSSDMLAYKCLDKPLPSQDEDA